MKGREVLVFWEKIKQEINEGGCVFKSAKKEKLGGERCSLDLQISLRLLEG